nr:right-handed parallel beta-helix repeat-containing protein [Methanobrevibacter arboriphilus]
MNRFKAMLLASLLIIVAIGTVSTVSAATHEIDDSNYSTYFDSDGNIIDSPTGIKNGDTIKLGDINGGSGKKFNINKNVSVTSKNSTSKLWNSSFTFATGSAGSSMKGINLEWATTGNAQTLVTISTSNIWIENCNLFLNRMTNSLQTPSTFIVSIQPSSTITNINLINNHLERSGGGSSGIVASNVNGLNIINNTIISGSGGFSSGNTLYMYSTVNNLLVDGNFISGSPSTISWAVYLMCSNAIIRNNNITGASVGINGGPNATIINNYIYGILSGANPGTGISAGANAKIINNTIVNSSVGINGSGANIFATGNTIITNGTNRGIALTGTNANITYNIITTENGTAISTTKANALISQNVISANGTGAGIVSSGATAIITYNNVDTNYGTGINSTGANATVSNNNVSSTNGINISITGPNSTTNNTNGIIYINDGTYSTYFDANGNILPQYVFGTVTLVIGTLTNKNLIVNQVATIVGNATGTIVNGTLYLAANGISASNLTFNNADKNAIEVNGVSNITLFNNIINIVGNFNPNYDYHTVTGISLFGDTSYINISSNNINITGNAQYSYAIINNIFTDTSGNPIQITKTLTNITIANNNMTVNTTGNYSTGIYSSTISNYTISNNNIFVSSYQFMYGIVVEDNSDIANVTGGLTPVTNVKILNNKVTGVTGDSGATASLIQLVRINNSVIDSNNINGAANLVYGLELLGSKNVNITNSNITINGSDNSSAGVMLNSYNGVNSSSVRVANNNFTIPNYVFGMGINDSGYTGDPFDDFVNNTLNGGSPQDDIF